MVKININLGNKTFYTLIAIISLITLAAVSLAWNSGNPQANGHTVDEIMGPNGTSFADYIKDIIYGAGELTCGSAIVDTVSSNLDSSNYYAVTISDPKCFQVNSESGCIIKQEVYSSTGAVLATRQYQYIQYSNNKWWSTYSTSGTYTNGDSSDNDIIPSAASGNIKLRDDSPAERTSTQWSYKDDSSQNMKLYLCSERSID